MAVATSHVDDDGEKVSAAGKSGKPIKQTEPLYYEIAVGVVIVGAILSFILEHEGWHVSVVQLGTGISAFAALYVGAQLIERILVPIAPIASSTTVSSAANSAPPAPPAGAGGGGGAMPDVQAHADAGGAAGPAAIGFISRRTAGQALTAWSTAARAPVPGAGAVDQKKGVAREQAENAATWTELLQQAKQNGNTTLWAIGTALGMLISAGGNVHLIRILSPDWKWAWADIVVTGFVLGGGSKNLHDFIGTLQDKNTGSNGNSTSGEAAASPT